MTVVQPNSIAGINSLTCVADSMAVHKSDGTLLFNLTSAGITTANKFTTIGISSHKDDVHFYGSAGTANTCFWDKSDNSFKFADDAKIKLGSGSDLNIYFDGTRSYIKDNVSNDIRIASNDVRFRTGADGATTFSVDGDGATALYHNQNAKLVTTSSGVSITGDLTVNGAFTKIDTTILDVTDKTVGVASTSAKTSVTQDGAGIVMYGQTDVEVTYSLNKAAVGVNTALSVSGFATVTGNVKGDSFTATGTGAIQLPSGTTAERPAASSSTPYMRWNSTNSALEFYNGTEWVEILVDYVPTGSIILGNGGD